MIQPGDLVRVSPLNLGGGLPKRKPDIGIVIEIKQSEEHQNAVWITYYSFEDGYVRTRYMFLSRIEKII